MLGTAGSPALPIGLLDHLASALALVDGQWRLQHVSGPAAQVLSRPVAELVGQVVWDLLPGAEDSEPGEQAHLAMRTRAAQRAEWYSSELDLWLSLLAVPVGEGLLLLVDDITEQRTAARRARRLVEVGEALARAQDPLAINAVVTDVALPLLEASGGTLVLPDHDGGPLRPLQWRGPAVAGGWTGLADASPAQDAHDTGQSVLLTAPDELLAVYPTLGPDLEAAEVGSLAALPLPGVDGPLGALVVAFAQPRSISSGDLQFLTTAAVMAGQALVRAHLIDVEQRSIDALQRSLLPRALATVTGLQAAARYRPTNGTAQIGGDWYDVVPLPGGGVALVMGDVEGHDLGAAALMGLVRSAVRAYALDGHPPSVVMARANAFLASLELGRLVTMSYAQLHPVEGLVIAASAGHPLTLVLSVDGDVEEIPSEVGPPLGVYDEGRRWPEITSTLSPGATLVLFTDGLVTGREHDEGLEGVHRVLQDHRGAGPDELAEALLAASRGATDDTALLVARLTTPGGAPLRLTRRLPPTPGSVPLSRAFARQLMSAWGVAEQPLHHAALIVTELVTNAARHSEDAMELSLALRPGVLRIEVADSSHRMPLAPTEDVADDATSGRGLLLVDALASRWGVDSEGLSKSVWAELDLP